MKIHVSLSVTLLILVDKYQCFGDEDSLKYLYFCAKLQDIFSQKTVVLQNLYFDLGLILNNKYMLITSSFIHVSILQWWHYVVVSWFANLSGNLPVSEILTDLPTSTWCSHWRMETRSCTNHYGSVGSAIAYFFWYILIYLHYAKTPRLA